jgi:PelA/Pel-15E family pectate lyase
MKPFSRSLPHRAAFAAAGFALLASTSLLPGAIIGTNVPARPLTAESIATLPKAEQSAWKDYLKRSERQRKADQDFLKKEMRREGIRQIVVPPEGRARRWIPVDRTNSWYGGTEARHIADVVLSFQTPAGGWSKNLNMAGNPRTPGMHFAPDNTSRHPGDADYDTPVDANWNYVGTFDNDATIMQLRFLARVIAASGTNRSEAYRKAFLHGLDYISNAQYPNGGWPQVWPLSGGYHDAITFNDNAMVNVLTLLRNVPLGTNEFAFVPARNRATAAASFQRGVDCLLKAQIVVDGQRTAWAQQCDMLTLQPASARNYEMPSAAAGESAGIMTFLMQLPNPGPEVITAVRGAAAWFEKTEIHGFAFRNVGSDGRELVPAPGNGPIWSRYYQIGTDRPIFGDRDKSIHDVVNEISKERRNGYSWYADSARRPLEQYAEWSKAYPVASGK